MKEFLSDIGNFIFSLVILLSILIATFFIGAQVGTSVNGQYNFHKGYKQALHDFNIVAKEK